MRRFSDSQTSRVDSRSLRIRVSSVQAISNGFRWWDCSVRAAVTFCNRKQPSELRIRAGEWDTQTNYEIFPHQDRGVRSVIVHEKYDAGAQFFDVAILILSEPVDYAENVDVVCLSEQNAVYDGSRCFASGWGKDKFGKDSLSLSCKIYTNYVKVNWELNNLIFNFNWRIKNLYQC